MSEGSVTSNGGPKVASKSTPWESLAAAMTNGISDGAAMGTRPVGGSAMSKSLAFWKIIFDGSAGRIGTLLESVASGAPGAAADLRAAMLNTIHHLRFGRILCEDLAALASGKKVAFDLETASAGWPWARPSKEGKVAAKEGKVVSRERPWWAKSTRWTSFGTHARRVLGLDGRTANATVLRELEKRLSISSFDASQLKDASLGKRVDVTLAVLLARAIVKFEPTLKYHGSFGSNPNAPTTVHGHNPSHLLALLERALELAGEREVAKRSGGRPAGRRAVAKMERAPELADEPGAAKPARRRVAKKAA